MPAEPSSPVSGYPVPARPVTHEIVITKSRFIGALRPVTSKEDVAAALDKIRAEHPTASHHCYAFRIGPPTSGSAGMSDDGEPSGTAGKPIFTVLGHKGVGDVLVVVTRYFGGVKLGAGGLVRAYMAAAEEVLSRMHVIDHIPTTGMTIIADYAEEDAVRSWCTARGVPEPTVRYSQHVELDLRIRDSLLAALQDFAASRHLHCEPTAR